MKAEDYARVSPGVWERHGQLPFTPQLQAPAPMAKWCIAPSIATLPSTGSETGSYYSVTAAAPFVPGFAHVSLHVQL
eukprot:4771598-Amphidinium_carterae.1